jgi:hypothetical protein
MKKLFTKKILFAGIAAAALLLGGNAQAFQIDDFNGGFDEIFGSDSSTRIYPPALGGTRTITLSGSDSDGDRLSVESVNGEGILWHENGSGLGPVDSQVQWDGNGADLTDGGSSDRFAIEFLEVRPQDSFSLRVAGGIGDQSVDFTVDGAGIATILFSDFDLLAPSDLESVARVELNITGASGLPRSSIQINNIATAPVPVPAAVWLLGGGLVGLLGLRRRFKS